MIAWILVTLVLIALVFLWLARRPALQSPTPKSPAPSSNSNNFREIFGHQLHFVQKGHGDDILLLHGIGASHFVWRFLMPRLSKNYRVTALDLLGFGLSDKPEGFSYDLDSQCEVILEFMKSMGIRKCTLVGSSMGGMITLRLAQMHPESFPNIVAISPAYDPKIAIFDLNRISFLSPMVQPWVSERFIKQIMKRVYSDKSLITLETVRIFSQPYSGNKLAIDSFVKSFRLLRDQRVFNELKNIRSHTLILWGERDKIIPVKFARKMKALIPHAVLLTHAQAGHHAHEDAPDWAFESIQSFLANEKTSKNTL